MTMILIGALIAIIGGIVGAIGTYRQNKSSSEKSTRIDSGVIDLRKKNGELILKIENQSKTIDILRKENIELYSKLANSSLNIYNNLTGGDAYCYCFFVISTFYPSKDIGNLYFKLGDNSENPLRNLRARIFDINTYNLASDVLEDAYKNTIFLETLDPVGAISLPEKFHLDKEKGVNLNIFFSANNGFFTQQLRMRFTDGEWATATVVTRDDKKIFEKVDKNYPEKDMTKIFK